MGEFPKEYEPTIFENYVAEIRLDGRHVQLALWDTAGQEEYDRLRPLSYAQSHVILIAFAIDTPDSLENVPVKWIDEVRSLCGPSVPVILIGCKADLRPYPPGTVMLPPSPSNPVPVPDPAHPIPYPARSSPEYPYVTPAQAEQVRQEIGARHYKECSALRNKGVDNVFEAATRASLLYREGGTGEKRERRASAGGNGKSGGKVRKDSHAGGCCVVA
jgi:GTPase SAR1 family protein